MQVEGRTRHAYNAQAIADEKEGVIVACETTRQETDTGQLVPMIEQARENLGPAAAQTLTVADCGYGAGADLQAAAREQMNVLVPPVESQSDHAYATRHFHYDASARTFNKRIDMGGRRYIERVRGYDLDEIATLFTAGGLTIRDVYGDFDGRPYEAGTSPRVILIGAKKK
jgi:hypothetical protein